MKLKTARMRGKEDEVGKEGQLLVFVSLHLLLVLRIPAGGAKRHKLQQLDNAVQLSQHFLRYLVSMRDINLFFVTTLHMNIR